MAEQDSKTCTKCGATQPLSMYIARTDNPGRYQSHCKTCVSAYMRRRYLANRDKVSGSRRSWYADNTERAKAAVAEWKARNPAKVWEYHHRRRARKIGEVIPPEALAQRMAFWGGKCWMCGAPASCVDHVKPLAVGGIHILSNLRPACKPCNMRKSAKWRGVARLHEFEAK